MPPRKNRPAIAEAPIREVRRLILAKSGLEFEVDDDLWVLLPNNGKGRNLRVDWIHDSTMRAHEKELILKVLINYARTKSASTAVTVATNIRAVLINGVPSLVTMRAMWSGFATCTKKSLNQFFHTSARLGHKEHETYHEFTSSHLDRSNSKRLDPRRGALSNIEFDSLAKNVNANLRQIDWSCDHNLTFYQASNRFGHVRNQVANKLHLSTVRRPVQLSMLKWSDLIPMGASFHDPGIPQSYEVGSVPVSSLQLRVFQVKSEGIVYSREVPERYPLYLSEDLSTVLMSYKMFLARGISLLLENGGVNIDPIQLPEIMNNMPVFPDTKLFCLILQSLDTFRTLFTPRSTAYHVSETSIALAMKSIRIVSDRRPNAIVTSNRIRHTVMTRAAQDGLPATQLAKITGVTVPAARHYIDFDYISRRMVDDKFVGNLFLNTIFSGEKIKEDDLIFDSNFNAVGSTNDSQSCKGCNSLAGRPLACYGCPNFRPFKEANHELILAQAVTKLDANRRSLLAKLHVRSVERLENQILWLKATILICDEVLQREQALDGK